MRRWYLVDGLFMGSVVEAEGLLAALEQALPPLGLDLNMRKTTVWVPTLVPAAFPLAASTRLQQEEGTDVLGVPILFPLYASAVEAHLGKLGAKYAHTCSAVGGLAETQSAHALRRNCLGPRRCSKPCAPYHLQNPKRTPPPRPNGAGGRWPRLSRHRKRPGPGS